MKKKVVKATLEDAFAVGKMEGFREASFDIIDLLKDGATHKTIERYIKLRLQSFIDKSNPFKKDHK